MLPVKLAKTLRTLRRKKRISLNQLAKATGLSRRTLARIEARHTPRKSTLSESRTRGTSRRKRSPQGGVEGPALPPINQPRAGLH